MDFPMFTGIDLPLFFSLFVLIFQFFLRKHGVTAPARPATATAITSVV
jgi:hypothetical protein